MQRQQPKFTIMKQYVSVAVTLLLSVYFTAYSAAKKAVENNSPAEVEINVGAFSCRLTTNAKIPPAEVEINVGAFSAIRVPGVVELYYTLSPKQHIRLQEAPHVHTNFRVSFSTLYISTKQEKGTRMAFCASYSALPYWPHKTK